jgi:hypothetical protein
VTKIKISNVVLLI